MSQSYREVSQRGYFANVKSAFAGMLFGLLFFIGSFFLLSWNEGNSVRTHADLNWAQNETVGADAQPVDAALEGRLVYVTGRAAVTQPIFDSRFAVSAPDALRLRRTVEMYQWLETKTTTERNTFGGGTEKVTEYTYRKGWSERAEKSSEFHVPAGHENPPMPAQSQTLDAGAARLGDYQLTPRVLRELNNFSRTLTPVSFADYRVTGDQLYKGNTPETPQVGDVRVQFTAVPTSDLSIIGKQEGNTFVEALGPNNHAVLLVEPGTVSASSMFETAHRTASMITWAIRAGGWLLMYIGLAMLLNPIKAIAGIIPGGRPVLGFGIGIISAVLALVLSSITIAIAWFAYRPLFSLGILAAGGVLALVILALKCGKQPVATPSHRSDGQEPIVQRQG